MRRTLVRPAARTASSTSCATPDSGTWNEPASTRGTRAGVVGTTEWPSASAMRRPWPSLPVFGSESPPVASTTRAAASSSRVVRRTKPPPAAARPPARAPPPAARRRAAPPRPAAPAARRASGSRPGRACRAPPRAARTPISRKKATVSSTPNARSTRRTRCGGAPLKSASVTTAFVTLQREPPLTRIFAPGRARSVEEHDRTRRAPPRGEDRRGQAGRPRPDDRDHRRSITAAGRGERALLRAGRSWSDDEDRDPGAVPVARHPRSNTEQVARSQVPSAAIRGALPSLVKQTPPLESPQKARIPE